jgi:hypothetical protein
MTVMLRRDLGVDQAHYCYANRAMNGANRRVCDDIYRVTNAMLCLV